MSKPVVLIQLIGEQTLPNTLPVLNLEPHEVHNICTAKTSKRGDTLRQWIVKKYGRQVKVIQEEIRGDLYAATLAKCKEIVAVSLDRQLVFNMTGGTKLMALAMYQVAAELEDAPVLYVDDNAQGRAGGMFRWVRGGGAEYVKGFHGSLLKRLSVLDILAVGEQELDESSISDWHKLLPAARVVQQVADNMPSTLTAQEIPRLRKAALADAALLESFRAAGCEFRPGGNGEHLNLMFLTGGWWEILVAEHLERSFKYRDIMCSIKTLITAKAPDMAEVDVLATDGFTLTSYSCKRRVPDSPDSEINKHQSRSRKLGGTGTLCGIAVYSGTYATQLKMAQLAKGQGLEVLTGAMVCPGMKYPPKPESVPGKDSLEKLCPPRAQGTAPKPQPRARSANPAVPAPEKGEDPLAGLLFPEGVSLEQSFYEKR